MTDTRESFWADYYGKLSERAEGWLDYSNERVQAQTFGTVFSALGPSAERRCLDVGCGYGQIVCALHAVGARDVVGIDVTPAFVERLRQRYPDRRWEVGSLDNDELCARLGTFDVITLVEVLQYVPIEATLRRAWDMLAAGGRMVAVVPNRDCPIVGRSMARFQGTYLAPTASELVSVGNRLELCQSFGIQGMSFAEDQALVPYSVSGWTRLPDFPVPPNRLVFAALKAQ